MRAVVRVLDSISDHLSWVSYLLIPLTLIIFIDVVCRYAFNSPLSWGYEVSLYMYAVTGLLAGAYSFLHNSHVRMDIFYNRLSPKGKAIIDLSTSVFFFTYIIILLVSTTQFAIFSIVTNQHSNSPFGPPLYPVKIVLVIAVIFMLLQGISKFIHNLHFVLHGKEI